MTMVKTLVALATERMLLKTSGPTFLRGIEFMYAAGLAPDRLSVMMTSSHKYVLQFHSKCDIRPFAANYPNFGRVLRGIVHVREWRIKSIEFVNVAFYMRDVDNLERAIEKLGVELVLLRNCTYPGVQRGDEAVKFLSALNRKKQAVVCEYGDDRLKHRIGRRASGHRTRRTSRNGQEVIAPPQDPAEVVAAPAAPAAPAAQPQLAAAAPAAAPVNPPVAQAQRPQAPPAPVQAQQQVRRPVPLNAEQARHAVPQMMVQQNPPQPAPAAQAPPAPAAPAAAAAPEDMADRLPGRASSGRLLVGAHVYEFRAVDYPRLDQLPAVQNLNHLLSVLSDNPQDVRVLVVPDPRHPINPVAAVNLNNNNNNPVMFRSLHYPFPLVPANLLPPMDVHPVPDGAAVPRPPIMREPRAAGPAQAPQADRVANAPAAAQPAAPVPMFGVAVNEPQVQRGGDDSNDSTDREEMDDQEPQGNNNQAADAEAQPHFAPVDPQAGNLEMLAEEAEAADDEVMEGVAVEGQYIIEERPIP